MSDLDQQFEDCGGRQPRSCLNAPDNDTMLPFTRFTKQGSAGDVKVADKPGFFDFGRELPKYEAWEKTQGA